MLEKGADIESREKTGKGQLSLAAKYGHKNVAQLLLKKGATVDSQDYNGYFSLVPRLCTDWDGLCVQAPGT
jgi:ankyrin repeat protein